MGLGTHTESRDYLIAYNVLVPDSANESNYEVFLTDMEGSYHRNLTNHPDVAWTYEAYDDRILFNSDRDTCYRCYFLYEMDVQGKILQKVSDIQLQDSWMGVRKEGQELLVNPKHDSVFYLIDREGNLLERLDPGMKYINDPAFSPDGLQIVFRGSLRSKKEKRDRYMNVPHSERLEKEFIDELYIMSSDGSDVRQLTHYPIGDTTALWYNYHAGPPRWHPKEGYISYQSKQDGKSSLFGVQPDGSSMGRLTDLEGQEGWHDWSPDGRYLVIEVWDLDYERSDIILYDMQRKDHKVLTGDAYDLQQAPVFVVP
ncbi:MAG: hypothetical protein HKN79_11650 [Flavobacteriales bacterium]|nr:hypothetical protein [Flavobacteriales bacterium]